MHILQLQQCNSCHDIPLYNSILVCNLVIPFILNGGALYPLVHAVSALPPSFCLYCIDVTRVLCFCIFPGLLSTVFYSIYSQGSFIWSFVNALLYFLLSRSFDVWCSQTSTTMCLSFVLYPHPRSPRLLGAVMCGLQKDHFYALTHTHAHTHTHTHTHPHTHTHTHTHIH